MSVGSFAAIAACTAAAPEEQAEETGSVVADLKLPSFVVTKAAEFGCGDVVREAFAGSDSAHGFSLDAKKGKAYHFEFRGDLVGNLEASLAIFDAATQQRVAVSRGKGRLGLDFTPAADGQYVVAAYTTKRAATGTYRLNQFCGIPGQNALVEGQTKFASEETRPQFFRGGPMALGARAEGAAAPAGRSAAVEEADVYKIDGTRLFYLNTYRGFLVYDVANSQSPKEVSRLPVYGYPVEMFVQNNVVYALMRDVLELKDIEGKLRFEQKHTSQLVAIDISNPAAPKVLQKVDITGDLREGLARKVGDTVYVVSEQHAWSYYAGNEEKKEQAWVYSFNVADPTKMSLVQKLKVFEGGGEQEQAQGQSSGKYFNGVTISATSNALMVTENWNTYSSVWGSGYNCGTSQSLQQAVVSIIDISNPQGKIDLHAKFETYGQLGDQFKQTYQYDAATKKAYYLGVFGRREWSSANCQGQSRIENNLEAWDVTNGAQPVRVSKLPFGKPNETVRGSVFDNDRGVLYAITAENVDPLYAIDFKNPAKTKILSAVDGLSGDMSVFRFIGDKKFLLAIGRDNSNTCTGFGPNAPGWNSQVAASIIDVQDASAIKLVQRKCITIDNVAWQGSEVNWNLDQAHKMIGLHETGLVNLVSVPVYYTKKIPSQNGGWDTYKSETAVGLFSWDLTKYVSGKAPELQNVLENASTVVHPGGEVKRTVVYNQAGIKTRRKLLNLSNTHMSISDIENVKAPTLDSNVEIAPYKERAIAFGGYVVEQIQPYSDYGWMENGATEFRVKAAGPNVDTAKTLATFSAASVERAVKFGDDTLVLFQRKTTQTQNQYKTELFATAYDLSSPTTPRKAGTVKLPVDYLPYPRFSAGVSSYFFPYWGDAQDMTATDKGLVFLTATYTQGGNTQRKLVGLDLTNVDAPAITEVALSSDKDVTLLGLAQHETGSGDPGSVWLSFRKKTGEVTHDTTTFDTVKYFAQKFSWSNKGTLAQGATVNVPGKVVKTFALNGKRMALTHDRVFDLQKNGSFLENPRMELVQLSGNVASLEDTNTLWGSELRDLVLDDGTLYTNVSDRSQRFWGLMPFGRRGGVYTPPTNELRIATLSTDKITERFSESFGTENLDLMGVHEKKLFVNLAGQGVLLVDAANPSKPVARDFVRTLGWSWSVDVAGNDALIAAGHYGIYQLGLNTKKTLGN